MKLKDMYRKWTWSWNYWIFNCWLHSI